MIRVVNLILAMSLCLVALSPLHTQAQSDESKGRIRRNEAAIPDHYIVVLKDGIDSAEVPSVARGLAQHHLSSPEFIYQHALKGFSARLTEAAALALSRNPMVEYVEEDAVVEGASIQQNASWGLDRIDQRDLPLNSTYSYSGDGSGVNVYVIDSGIRFSHQEFSGRASNAFDFVADGQNGNDCFGHGTHVAAIIAGNSFGVAKAARLHSVRVLDCLNRGSLSRVIAGVDWVRANHIKPAVANLSFISTTASDTLDASVRNTIAAGVACVVSAGNVNVDAGTRSPSRVVEAITVAASDQSDARASTSNYGSVVDVFAPGVEINSAWATDDAATTLRSGTSSAAGFVSGMVARLLQANPAFSPADVSRAITANSSPDRVRNLGPNAPNLLLYSNRASGKIAFTSDRDGNPDLFVMDPDGSNQVKLTSFSGVYAPNKEATWSPDGEKIAFSSYRDGNYEVYTMNSDGSAQTRLTNSPGFDFKPAWSPDGSKIAFVSDRDGNYEIYTMNSDGSGQSRVTTNATGDLQPAWSPDGTKICFVREDSQIVPDIYVMNADGSNVVRLTNSLGADSYPAWSPDGKRIAFRGSRHGGNPEIYVMNADGSGQTRVTYVSVGTGYPTWSPDSNRIAFWSFYNSSFKQLCVINGDGSNFVTLTNTQGNNDDAAYQPLFPTATTSGLIISEFRLRGPGGAADEFIKLHNSGSVPISVSTADGSEGWTVAAISADGLTTSARFTIPKGTVIPARGHFLAVGSGYSLFAVATASVVYPADIEDNSGIALFKTANPASFTPANRLDAVGFTGVPGASADLYREGAGLAPVGVVDGEYSLMRKITTGYPQDTNNNAADFQFISTTGDSFGGGVISILGAPGPSNRTSPVPANIATLMLDPLQAASTAPNRVRALDPVPNGDNGTLSIRRTFTNNTGKTIRRLRFRVIDMTTLNSPLVYATQADCRVIDSSDVTVTLTDGRVVTVKGTTVEAPAQPLGGGLNTTVTVALPSGGLAPGASINAQFLLGIMRGGTFKFYIFNEASE